MRTIENIPEGGCSVEEMSEFGIIDNTDEIGEGVTKEWFVTYVTHERSWEKDSFLVHARTIKEAFEHFISLKPNTYVKAIKYYDIYF